MRGSSWTTHDYYFSHLPQIVPEGLSAVVYVLMLEKMAWVKDEPALMNEQVGCSRLRWGFREPHRRQSA
jgi:hypothetical protein